MKFKKRIYLYNDYDVSVKVYNFIPKPDHENSNLFTIEDLSYIFEYPVSKLQDYREILDWW